MITVSAPNIGSTSTYGGEAAAAVVEEEEIWEEEGVEGTEGSPQGKEMEKEKEDVGSLRGEEKGRL